MFIHRFDGHPLYLQLIDSKLGFATNVISSLGEMDINTPLLSLEEVSAKLGQVAEANLDRSIVVSAFLCVL